MKKFVVLSISVLCVMFFFSCSEKSKFEAKEIVSKLWVEPMHVNQPEIVLNSFNFGKNKQYFLSKYEVISEEGYCVLTTTKTNDGRIIIKKYYVQKESYGSLKKWSVMPKNIILAKENTFKICTGSIHFSTDLKTVAINSEKIKW